MMPYENGHRVWEQEPQTFPRLLPAGMIQNQPELPAGMDPGTAVPLTQLGTALQSCWQGTASLLLTLPALKCRKESKSPSGPAGERIPGEDWALCPC